MIPTGKPGNQKPFLQLHKLCVMQGWIYGQTDRQEEIRTLFETQVLKLTSLIDTSVTSDVPNVNSHGIIFEIQLLIHFAVQFLSHTHINTSLICMTVNGSNINPQHQLSAVYVYEQNLIPTDCDRNKAEGPQSVSDFFFNQLRNVLTNTSKILTP